MLTQWRTAAICSFTRLPSRPYSRFQCNASTRAHSFSINQLRTPFPNNHRIRTSCDHTSRSIWLCVHEYAMREFRRIAQCSSRKVARIIQVPIARPSSRFSGSSASDPDTTKESHGARHTLRTFSSHHAHLVESVRFTQRNMCRWHRFIINIYFEWMIEGIYMCMYTIWGGGVQKADDNERVELRQTRFVYIRWWIKIFIFYLKDRKGERKTNLNVFWLITQTIKSIITLFFY